MRAIAGAAVLVALTLTAARAEMAAPESTLQPPPAPGQSPRSGTYSEPKASAIPRFEEGERRSRPAKAKKRKTRR